MWRNIQLSFIDTHILIHWFIDDHDDDSNDDEEGEKEGLYKKHKLIYIYIHRCRREREHSRRAGHRECDVIITIRTYYIVQYSKCMRGINLNLCLYAYAV